MVAAASFDSCDSYGNVQNANVRLHGCDAANHFVRSVVDQLLYHCGSVRLWNRKRGNEALASYVQSMQSVLHQACVALY